MKRQLKNIMSLDQFYTNPDIAKKCYKHLESVISVDDYDCVLEPSAGTGSFFILLPENKKLGLDIEPKSEGIVQMDFFEFKPDPQKKYLVIGNPPFGIGSSIAVKFFNKSAGFSDCIAFIIPRTFKRASLQNKLDLNFSLIFNEDLPLTPCCFSPKMSAKCCFQIWKRIEVPREKVIYDKTHGHFCFVKHGPKDIRGQPTPPKNADFVMKAYGSNCGELQDSDLESLRPKSWHWIKSNINIELLKSRFRRLDYSMSKDTVRQDSIGQQEVIHLYKQLF
jgi:hypothetical protein